MKNDQKFTVDGDLVAESINLTSHITKLIDDQMIAKKDITFDSPTLISLNASALSAKETIIFNSQEFTCELSVIRAGIMHIADTNHQSFNAKSIYISYSDIKVKNSIQFATEKFICRDSLIEAKEIKFFQNSDRDFGNCKFIGESYLYNLKDEL